MTMIRLVGEACTMAATSSAAVRMCSMLSRIRIIERSATNDSTAEAADRSGPSKMPIPWAIAALTWSGLSSAARLTNHAPSRNRGSRRRAASIARLVLPIPPGPVSVTRRASCAQLRRDRRVPGRDRRTRSADPAGCRAVPPTTEAVGSRSAGRRYRAGVSLSARGTSFSTCRPRSRRLVPSGRASATRVAVVSDSTTWPPCPTAATRAARLTSKPP